jgi:predicted nucleic acid-binding protein
MKMIVFDTGPVITLSVNALLWVLYPLKKQFKGKFIITPSVKRELIDLPMRGKKYKFEALRVNDMLNEGIFQILSTAEIKTKAKYLMNLANNCFFIGDKNLQIVQEGEMESLAAAVLLNADAFVVDERVTRMLIESPDFLERTLENKLNADVKVNIENLNKFHEDVKNVNVIRSVELITVAYKLGILDKYVVANNKVDYKMKDVLLYSALWALKLYGCAVSSKEIDRIVHLEK